MSRRALALLVPLAALLAGCRLDVVAAVALDADGGGRASLTLEVDEALREELDGLGVDPSAPLTAAARAEGWQLDREEADDGGLQVRLEHEGDDPLGALAALGEGLDERDPALLIDLERRDGADGQVTVSGTARLRPPAAAGALDAEGRPVGPGPEELAEAMREHVSATLQVRPPGRVADAGGAEVVDGAAVHRLPVDEQVEVEVTSVPSARDAWLIAGAVTLLAIGAVALALLTRRRRR